MRAPDVVIAARPPDRQSNPGRSETIVLHPAGRARQPPGLIPGRLAAAAASDGARQKNRTCAITLLLGVVVGEPARPQRAGMRTRRKWDPQRRSIGRVARCPLSAHSETRDASRVMFVVERKRGAQPIRRGAGEDAECSRGHPAQRSRTHHRQKSFFSAYRSFEHASLAAMGFAGWVVPPVGTSIEAGHHGRGRGGERPFPPKGQ